MAASIDSLSVRRGIPNYQPQAPEKQDLARNDAKKSGTGQLSEFRGQKDPLEFPENEVRPRRNKRLPKKQNKNTTTEKQNAKAENQQAEDRFVGVHGETQSTVTAFK